MAISSKELYEDFLFVINKNNSEYVSPEEAMRLADLASNDLYKDYLGDRNARRAVYGHNSITDHRLNVFRRSTDPIPYNRATRQIPVPEDCKHIRSVTDNDGMPAKYQDDNRFYMLRRDPTTDLKNNCYYKEENNHLEFSTDKPVVDFTIQYLKTPNRPELPYTIVDREIVYDDANVVDLEWSRDEKSAILNRMLIFGGIVIRDMNIAQVGRINKSEE